MEQKKNSELGTAKVVLEFQVKSLEKEVSGLKAQVINHQNTGFQAQMMENWLTQKEEVEAHKRKTKADIHHTQLACVKRQRTLLRQLGIATDDSHFVPTK